MLPGTAIYGVVTGPNGAPLANASIASCGLPDQICGRGRSDSRGRYRATVGIGLFTVRVTAQVSGESFDGYIGQFGLTFSRARAIQLLGQPGAAHGASVQLTRAPTVSFVSGTQLNSAGDSAALSTRIAWGATSDPATAYRLLERLDLGATHQIASVAAATFSGSLMEPLTVGHGYRFDVRSTTTTGAGHITRGVHRGPVFDLLLYQDSGSQVTYAGTRKRLSGADRSGGSAMTSASMGASARFVFSGRAVGWISRTGPHSGTAQVYVDGQFAGTFDLSAPKVSVRTVVFSRSWPAAGTHTVEISESAIGSHPPVEIDAFVVMD